MANITLQYITPRHFYEAVKLLKSTEYRIYYTVNSLEIRFPIDNSHSFEETQARFEQMEHLGDFLKELTNSSIPVDLEEFIQKYRYQLKQKFYKFK